MFFFPEPKAEIRKHRFLSPFCQKNINYRLEFSKITYADSLYLQIKSLYFVQTLSKNIYLTVTDKESLRKSMSNSSPFWLKKILVQVKMSVWAEMMALNLKNRENWTFLEFDPPLCFSFNFETNI